MSINGKVKWFNGVKGYGFITPEDGSKDIFVHTSAVRDAGMNDLVEGQAITFETQEGPKGLTAVNLSSV
jgi:CspA family cold shock protein